LRPRTAATFELHADFDHEWMLRDFLRHALNSRPIGRNVSNNELRGELPSPFRN
jgi:hypothetical protein